MGGKIETSKPKSTRGRTALPGVCLRDLIMPIGAPVGGSSYNSSLIGGLRQDLDAKVKLAHPGTRVALPRFNHLLRLGTTTVADPRQQIGNTQPRHGDIFTVLL